MVSEWYPITHHPKFITQNSSSYNIFFITRKFPTYTPTLLGLKSKGKSIVEIGMVWKVKKETKKEKEEQKKKKNPSPDPVWNKKKVEEDNELMMKSTENQRTKKKEEVWYDERGES